MRVNNINTLSFKRVIPVEYAGYKKAEKVHGVDSALIEVEDILNSFEPFYYSKEESAKIREFFRQRIEDYNGKGGVLIAKTGNRTALLTGGDAIHIKNLRASKKSEQYVSGVIAARMEDGKNGKPQSSIVLKSKARNRALKTDETLTQRESSRFDMIKYGYEYFSKRPEKLKDLSGKAYTSFAAGICEKAELKI